MRKTTSTGRFSFLHVWWNIRTKRKILTKKYLCTCSENEWFFHILVPFGLKLLLMTFTHQNFSKILCLLFPIQIKISRNSKGCCLSIYLNIPFESTNSLFKNIDINSANIYKSPLTKYLYLRVIVTNKFRKQLDFPQLETNCLNSCFKFFSRYKESTMLKISFWFWL